MGRTRDGRETGYGLGWNISQWKGQRMIGHGGAQARVSTLLQTIPARRFAVAWMCNLEGAGGARIAQDIAALLLP